MILLFIKYIYFNVIKNFKSNFFLLKKKILNGAGGRGGDENFF